ncbi:MAG: hypothetical protein Q7S02_02930 [bacterium]|nr:hypothetical protein [bacterium]
MSYSDPLGRKHIRESKEKWRKEQEALPHDMTKRCPKTQPETGERCGLEQGHSEAHALLIPTGSPWFPK